MIKSISTRRVGKGNAVEIKLTDEKESVLTHSQITSLGSEANIKAAIIADLGVTIPIFIHINSDNSVAVATGSPPILWPEDEKI